MNYKPYDEHLKSMVDIQKAIVSAKDLEDLKKYEIYASTRQRAKTDLFFLAKYVLGKDMMEEGTHRRVCDFFIQKDETISIGEQSWIKERLLLYPRGGFKSTIDVCDAVQWILNFPNIRILFLTATDDLAI